MAAGEPCKGKGCKNVQPCEKHRANGNIRKNQMTAAQKEQARGNVHQLFSDERAQQVHDRRPPGGDPDPDKDPRGRRYVRQRLGKRWSQIHDEVAQGQYTWDDFVEDLDAEELARAQLRAEDGTFRGRPPEFIPRSFYLACQREMIARFNRSIHSNFEKATNELIRLGMDERAMEPKDRVKILQYLIERVVGKVPDKLEVKAADPWETIIGDILAEAPDGTGLPPYMSARAEKE